MTDSQTVPQGFWGNLRKRVDIEWLLVTVIMLLLTAALNYFDRQLGVSEINHALYDLALAQTAHGVPRDDVVIIAIDDTSIDDLGHWPWRRSVHAALLEKLGNARVVGFDVLFIEHSVRYPQDDHILAQAIARHGRVVLPYMIDHENRNLIMPLGPYAEAAAGLGYLNIFPDDDGSVRSLILRRTLASEEVVDHFLVAMLDVAARTSGQAFERGVLPHDTRLLIPYGGPAGHFAFYPYSAVLRGDVPAEAFSDRMVLVGSWGSGLGDTFPTPMTAEGVTLSGVEILANGLNSLASETWIETPRRLIVVLLGCLPVLVVCLAFRRLSPRQSFAATLTTMFLVVVFCLLLLRFAEVWIPVAASLIGVALSLPVWSWRSQEASLQHIDRELASLAASAPARATSEDDWLVKDRSFPARIEQLHRAITQFRRTQKQREETVRFLSHDMRAPQNAILALIELQNYGAALSLDELLKRIERHATTTLELMDGFVQLAHVEGASLTQDAIDVSDIVQEASDAFWALAAQRNITLTLDGLPEHAWVRGDASLLLRALTNLIDNAIKYSADHTQIRCRLARHDNFWALSIEDEGRGMTAEQIEAVFQPFARADTDALGNPGGAGLGLPFVRVVAEKHGGSIALESWKGKGSRFTLRLPALDDGQSAG